VWLVEAILGEELLGFANNHGCLARFVAKDLLDDVEGY
jgi:hypothetical protein